MADRVRRIAASRGNRALLVLGLLSLGLTTRAFAGALPDSSHGGPRLPAPIHFVLPSSGGAASAARPGASPSAVQADDGVWSQFSPPDPNPPTPISHVGVFDTAHNRMIVHGGFGLMTDTWSLDLGSMTWSPLATTNPPPQRWAACAIYDPVGDRMIMFGGYVPDRYSDDLWVLPLHGTPTWTQIPTAGLWPGPRLYASAIYDPLRHRMIVFGGEAGPSFNDTWALNLDDMTWTQLVPTGTLPIERYGHTAIYDPAADEMVIYGGGPDDVFALGLGANPHWRQLTPLGSSPGGRIYHTAILDTQQERMIVHGGWVGYGLADTWQLTLGPNPAWTQLQPTGVTPVPRWLHNALYDPGNARMVVFGGRDVGDLRAIYWSSQSISPAIFSLDPPSGYEGEHVLVHGVFPETPSSAQFNGLDATIVSGTSNTIELIVPVGVSSGYVTIHFPGGTLTSPLPFTVIHQPVITSVSQGAAPIGTLISIYGQYLTGVTRVAFGSSSYASFTVISDTEIQATVDANAVTGPITVYAPFATTTSSLIFTVIRNVPIITSFTPIQGTVGTTVTIIGQYFSTASRVAFGASSYATFHVDSDVQITATVDSPAVTGPISVTNIDGTTASASSFTVIVPVYPVALAAVLDAPNDQGGKLILEWLASDFDIGQNHSVTKYRIWRRAPLFSTHALPSPAAGTLSLAPGTGATVPAILSGFMGVALPLDSAPAGFWESIGEIPAARIPGYAFTAPTLQDSLPGSNPYTAFVVQSVTGDPSQLYFSDPDSGYSVDNLAPPIPMPFAATYASNMTTLHWTTSHAPDFAEFRLYRGASADFVPGDANLVVATGDTSFVDVAGTSTYKLAAIDVHGNHSKYAVVSPAQPAAVLAALTFVDPQPDRIRLTWYAAGEPSLIATLYRRTPGSDWTRVTTLTSDGGGLLQYDDRAVVEGGLYGYRLGIMDAGVEVFAGEVWATASRPALALEGILPNPAVNGRFSVAFALPTNEPARLEVLDVTGRRVVSQEVGSLGPGRHQFALGSGGRMAPGVYLVRLVQAQSSRTSRVVVIE